MEVERFAGGFVTRYSAGIVKESVADYDSNSVSFSFSSGNKIHARLPRQARVDFFNSQFGISITQDGRFFFIQSWEKNTVSCFRITDCKKMWSSRIRHPYGLCACENTLLCYAMHNGVYKLAIDNGDVIAHFRCAYTKFFHFLSGEMFFIGPIKNEYKLMDFDFRQVAVVPIHVANPNCYDTFIIKEIALADNSLHISGTEYNMLELQGIPYQQQEKKIYNARFCREIKLNPSVHCTITHEC